MNLTQILEALPPLVYLRRGELVVQFSTPADLVVRVGELSSALTLLDQESSRASDPRGRNKQLPRISANGTRSQLESESAGGSLGDGRPDGSAGSRSQPD